VTAITLSSTQIWVMANFLPMMNFILFAPKYKQKLAWASRENKQKDEPFCSSLLIVFSRLGLPPNFS